MAQLLSSTISGDLTVTGQLLLGGTENTCLVTSGNVSNSLGIATGLRNILNANYSLNLVGGTTENPTGIHLDSGNIIFWTKNGQIRGFGADGYENFQIDPRGRYLATSNAIREECGTSTDDSRMTFRISSINNSTYSSVNYLLANKDKTLTSSNASISGTEACTVEISNYSYSPLPNGLLLLTGTWAVSKSRIKSHTWFKIRLPAAMRVLGATLSELDNSANGEGNGWFVHSEAFTGSYVDYLYICKASGNAGTKGFSFMAIGQLADQSNLPGIFRHLNTGN